MSHHHVNDADFLDLGGSNPDLSEAVFAAFDERPDIDRVLNILDEAGAPNDRIHELSGAAGMELLKDAEPKGLSKLFQWLSTGDEVREMAIATLRNDGIVMTVHDVRDEQAAAIRRAFDAAGASMTVHFGRWTHTNIPA